MLFITKFITMAIFIKFASSYRTELSKNLIDTQLLHTILINK
jgi:hypothetical protein